jgi:hypothetical protein
MAGRHRWRPSWRPRGRQLLATAAVAFLVLALADYDAPKAGNRYILQQPDSGYCRRAAAVLSLLVDVVYERRSFQEIGPELAALDAGFKADEARFLRQRRLLMVRWAETLRGVSSTMADDLRRRIQRGKDLTSRVRDVSRGVILATKDYCREAPTYGWLGEGTVEARVPATWSVQAVPWMVSGGVAGPGIVLAFDPGLWRDRYLPQATRIRFTASDPRYLHPGAYLAASFGLARQLRLDGTRTAVALDRLRAWMDSVRYDADCQLVHVSPFTRPSSAYWGFVREWRDCQGIQTALVEAYVLSTAAGPDRPMVILLQTTATGPGELSAVPRLLDSFHVIWERLS